MFSRFLEVLVRIIDRWNECYEGVHRQTPPKEFKEIFCNHCMNASCTNSRGSGMSWSQRMSTQTDRLLDNPLFADQRDPRFDHIRSMEFQSMVEREIAIRVSTEKGDWSVPTRQEVSNKAAEMIGIIPPTGFKKEEPEPKQPEVKVEPEKVEESKEEKEVLDSWRVKGSQKEPYEVTQYADGTWYCTCGHFQNTLEKCKHIAQLEKRVVSLQPAEESEVIPRRPPPITEVIPSMNAQSQSGFMVGGSKPPEEPADPWAAPKKHPPTGTIPVGGTFTFGANKKK